MHFLARPIVWITDVNLCAREELGECELFKYIASDIRKCVGQCLFYEWQKLFQKETEVIIDGRIDDISQGCSAAKQIV